MSAGETVIFALRTRSRFVAQVDVAPIETLTFSVSGGIGSDDFDDSGFGLQELAFPESGNHAAAARAEVGGGELVDVGELELLGGNRRR